MRYSFASALLATLATARDWREPWAPNLTQEEWDRDRAIFEFGATYARDWFFNHLPVHSAKSQLEGYAWCGGCQGAVKIVQSLFRDAFAQHFVENVGSDICWLGGNLIDHDSCSLFVVQAAPAVMDNLAAFLISPEYTCEVEFDYCNF